MEALRLTMDLPRAALVRALRGRWPVRPGAPLSVLRWTVDAPRPELPGPDWVRIRPILSGICGTDMAVLQGKQSAALSPFASFPCVPGHEVVGRVVETGPAVAPWRGKRVVVDPALTCRVRGLDPCAGCREGQPQRCTGTTSGHFAPGLLLGFCRDLPGAWAEELVAHESQLHEVPDAVDDDAAVLVEPFGVALHAVLRHPPAAGERVAVVGAGTIGLCVTAALAWAGYRCETTVVARHAFQAVMARRLGAARTAADVFAAAREVAGAVPHRPLFGRDVLTGGFDRVFDCVGSPRTIAGALAAVREGGTVVIVGGAGEIATDWTPVWAREITVSGSYAYGLEPVQALPAAMGHVDGPVHTFRLALALLRGSRGRLLGELVTHRFTLGDWRRAFRRLAARRQAKESTIKVVFEGGR